MRRATNVNGFRIKYGMTLLGLLLTLCISINSTFGYTNEELGAANFLAKKGIIVDNYYSPSDYNLDQPVLRQEIAGVVRALVNIPKKTSCEGVFKDVSATRPNTWACSSVEALVDNGIIARNNYFNPETNISKSEAVGMVVGAVYSGEYSSNGSNWQQQAVNFAVDKGISYNFTDYNANAYRGFIFLIAAKALGYNSSNYQTPDTGMINPNLSCPNATIDGYVLKSASNLTQVIPQKTTQILDGYYISSQTFVCMNGKFVKSGTETITGTCNFGYLFVKNTKACVPTGDSGNNNSNVGNNCSATTIDGYSIPFAYNGNQAYPIKVSSYITNGKVQKSQTFACINGYFNKTGVEKTDTICNDGYKLDSYDGTCRSTNSNGGLDNLIPRSTE